MTRINANLPPENLCDEHLLAEHREIKRIGNRFKVRLEKNKFDDIPKKFTLGKGHELFFVDKPMFTYARYLSIWKECKYRDFNVTDFSESWQIYWDNLELKESIWKEYDHDDLNDELIIQRISERLNGMKKIHYRGESITADKAIKILRYGPT